MKSIISLFPHHGKTGRVSVVTYLAAGMVGGGMILRIMDFALNRSLWFDEALLALNLINRSFSALMQPLENNQGAPLGFLFIQKIIIVVLGNKDYLFLLFPLVTGLIGVYAMYRVASIYLPNTGALVSIGLFAFSYKLITYASTNKQYSSDALVTILLLFFAFKCLEENPRPRQYIALIIGGVVSLWISHSALFILVGVGLVLAVDRLIRKDRRELLWIGMLFLIWAINAGILYFISLRSLTTNSALLDYWRLFFMPMPPWREPAWVVNSFYTMFKNPGGFINPWTAKIGLIIFFIGCISLLFRKWQWAMILMVPYPVVLLASGLDKYPFGDRFLIFSMPILFLLVGEGIERIRSLLIKLNDWVAFGICLLISGLLFYNPITQAVKNMTNPNMGENIKPVLAYVQLHKLETDTVYIYYGAFPAFSYYAPSYGFGPNDYIVGITSRQKPGKYIKDIDKLKQLGRVWFIFSHNCSGCKVNERNFYLDYLNSVGTIIDKFKASSASTYLYHLGSREQ